MATLANGVLTLADWAKRLDPEGKVPVVAELLSQRNAILEDAVFQEGNLPTGHRVVIRTGLPTVYWRSSEPGRAAFQVHHRHRRRIGRHAGRLLGRGQGPG